jgi:hypothetical protein
MNLGTIHVRIATDELANLQVRWTVSLCRDSVRVLHPQGLTLTGKSSSDSSKGVIIASTCWFTALFVLLPFSIRLFPN